MIKKLIIIGIALILISIILSGCNEVKNPFDTEKNKFVGTWKASEYDVWTFFSNGTYSKVNDTSGTWELKDGKLVISLSGGELVDTYNYIFVNDITLRIRHVAGGVYTPFYKQ